MTTQFTKDQISQALMINEVSSVVSNIDRDRAPTHEGTIQLFAIGGITRSATLHQVFLPKEGELKQYKLVQMRYHRSVSKTPAYRNRTQYIQVLMDNKAYTNDEERLVIRNQNPALLNHFLTPKLEKSGRVYNNPWNTLFISYFVRTAPLPVDITPELISKYNQASYKIRAAHAKAKAEADEKGFDLGTNVTYRKIMEQLWNEYLTTMAQLIQNEEVTIGQVLNVADNSLVPAFTMDSGLDEDNPFTNAVDLLKSEISYMPTINKFFGYAKVNSSAETDDINSELLTGVRPLGREDATDAGSMAKRKEAMKLSYISDVFGNKTSIPLRRLDQGYISSNGDSSKSAEIFDAKTSHNEGLWIMGEYVPTVIASGQGNSNSGVLRGTLLVDAYYTDKSASFTGLGETDATALNSASEDIDTLFNQVTFTADQTDPLAVFDSNESKKEEELESNAQQVNTNIL